MHLRLFAPRYWPTWVGLLLLRLVVLLPYPQLLSSGRHNSMFRRAHVAEASF